MGPSPGHPRKSAMFHALALVPSPPFRWVRRLERELVPSCLNFDSEVGDVRKCRLAAVVRACFPRRRCNDLYLWFSGSKKTLQSLSCLLPGRDELIVTAAQAATCTFFFFFCGNKGGTGASVALCFSLHFASWKTAGSQRKG